jgi:hypothetical protein
VSCCGICFCTVCVAAGGRMITLLVLIDGLKMVIRSGDVPCCGQVMVFACRVNGCVSHEGSFCGCVERVAGAKDSCCFFWRRPCVRQSLAPRYRGKLEGGTRPDRRTCVPDRSRSCLEEQWREANPDGRSWRRAPQVSLADQRGCSRRHHRPRTHSERHLTSVGRISGGLLLDCGVGAVAAKLQAGRLGCLRTMIIVACNCAVGAGGQRTEFVRTTVAFMSLQQTCIGDACSQPEQPHQQHHECDAALSAGFEKLHDANFFRQFSESGSPATAETDQTHFTQARFLLVQSIVRG